MALWARTRALARRFRVPFIVAAQLLLVALASRLAFHARFGAVLPPAAADVFWSTLPWLVAIDAVLLTMVLGAIRSPRGFLNGLDVPIKTRRQPRDIIDCRVEGEQIRNLSLEGLLSRKTVGLDARPVRELIAGKRILVTGAGGSIGSELCRQIARCNPARLGMLERHENSLHEVKMELHDSGFGSVLATLVGDVTDVRRVDAAMHECQPDIVFHAAAHKHVPLMEENPCEAIKNNVYGTRVLAEAAARHGASRFICISTDKAVKPASVMGASKRVAELLVQSLAGRGGDTAFAIVRFGNVLGSNGSVLPRFLDQIRRGGPVTVTHPDMRRYFMLAPEAVQLVLHASAFTENGLTYVLEMGEPVRVLEMARELIRLSGSVPEDDIKIEFVGVRPGEKLFEELVGPEEQATASAAQQILCVRGLFPAPTDFLTQVRALESDAFDGRTADVLARLQRMVGLPPDGDREAAPEAVVANQSPRTVF